MIHQEQCLVVDIDGTLCPTRQPGQSYADLLPDPAMIAQLHAYRAKGFYIILATARNMKTHDGNVGRITATTGKVLLEWLERHAIPHDELHLGKPWCGRGGFYIDDKSIRPDEFKRLSYEDILALIGGKEESGQ